ncbi:hypothetical protein [Brevundimonas sp.]
MPIHRPPTHRRASAGLPNWAIIAAIVLVVVVLGLLVGGALGL